jgi:hypothetical protein
MPRMLRGKMGLREPTLDQTTKEGRDMSSRSSCLVYMLNGLNKTYNRQNTSVHQLFDCWGLEPRGKYRVAACSDLPQPISQITQLPV